jgi:hypothetical protein
MKQLVVKALREHFRDGATTRQMLDFFRDAWDRDIERTNLSPQVSRLLQEGIISHLDDGRWVLIELIERKAYRLLQKAVHDGVLRNPGDVVMLYPHEVADHHEPIDTDEGPETSKGRD